MHPMKALPAIVVLALVAARAAADDSVPNVVTLTASAKKKLDAGDAKGAAEDLSKALDLAPRNASLRHERAVCRAKLGDATGAVADLTTAAQLAPADYPMDLVLWREAVDRSRAAGGSKEPDIALISAEVAQIRGKAFKAAVACEPQSPKDFGAAVDQSIDRELPRAQRDDMQAGLRRLGFVPEGFDFKKEFTDAQMSQAAAYYDPKTKKFYNLFTGIPAEMIEATAAHELVHALQDQYFDLDPWLEAHGGSATAGVRNDDRVFALRCVAEGEAVFVQTIWQMEHVLRLDAAKALATTRSQVAAVAAMDTEDLLYAAKAAAKAYPPGSDMAKAVEEIDKIEPYIMEPLLAAYTSGACLVGTAEESGWAAVDQLFADPPQTSEQCLHPEKFVKTRDLPTPIALPNLPDIAAGGWREADTAIHGELYFRILLKRLGVAADLARRAAAGWDGDIYRAWRAADGRTAIVLATTWDTEKDAAEFFDGYRATLAKKYAKLVEERGSDLSSLRYTYGAESLGTGALVLRGREVFAVEGFAADLRTTVVAALVAMKIAHVD